MIFYFMRGWQFKNIRTLFLIFLLGAWHCTSVAKNNESWAFYNALNSTARIIQSPQAQDGNRLLVIDGTELEFSEKLNYSGNQFLSQGYMIQTIDADQLRGQNFHVSGFARSSQPNFEKLEDLFRENYARYFKSYFEERIASMESDKAQRTRAKFQQMLERRLEIPLEFFADSIRSSNANADFGITVLLHMQEGNGDRRLIKQNFPTSAGSANSIDVWNRFNIEMGVPKDCKAVSIVLWSEGINIVQFDHIAMVEQGEFLDERRTSNYLSTFDGLYQYFLDNSLMVNPNLSNPSFEQ